MFSDTYNTAKIIWFLALHLAMDDFCYIHSPTGYYPTAFDAIAGEGHRPNIAITFGTEKTRIVVYHAGGERTKCDDMFSRFDTIRLCNGRTDEHLATA